MFWHCMLCSWLQHTGNTQSCCLYLFAQIFVMCDLMFPLQLPYFKFCAPMHLVSQYYLEDVYFCYIYHFEKSKMYVNMLFGLLLCTEMLSKML